MVYYSKMPETEKFISLFLEFNDLDTLRSVVDSFSSSKQGSDVIDILIDSNNQLCLEFRVKPFDERLDIQRALITEAKYLAEKFGALRVTHEGRELFKEVEHTDRFEQEHEARK